MRYSQKPKRSFIPLVLLIIIGGGVYFFNNTSIPDSSAPSTTTSNNQTVPENTDSQTGELPVSSGMPVPSATPVVDKIVTHNVSIENFSFNQKSLIMKKGDTVVWTNNDSAPHTVTGGAGGPASGTLARGETYSFTFNNVGSFAYHCNFHPSMTGTVTVTQ